ncbi:MAG: SlyX family protein [Gammaproteobacteria bacterium]|nr:SlyX family protein [Gammaproteobacteria bacterium]
MTTEINRKLTELETLYSEQEYTIHTLNEIVIRQDQEICRLDVDLKWLKQQLIALKDQIPVSGDTNVDEIPPHY